MTVGIVVPTYRESENVGSLITELRRVIPSSEIVIVDDSPDLITVDAVERVGDSRTTVIHREKKDGRGSAVLTGMAMHVKSHRTRIVEMDADFSHAPSELPGLLEVMARTDSDMLIASRYLPDSQIVNWPVTRLLFSRYSNSLARALLQVPVRDYTNGFRLYRHEAARTVVETCGKIGKGFIPLSETLVNLYYRGYRIEESPTVFVNRSRGESSLTFNEIQNAFFGLLRIWKLRRRLAKNMNRDLLNE